MTNALEEKENYRGFNEALARFMAEDGPARLIYDTRLNTCFTKTYSDERNVQGKDSEYPEFKTLVYKGLVLAK